MANLEKTGKLGNIENLRDFALEILQDLRSGKIDMSQALASGKLVDNVVNTIKVEMDYQKMTNEHKLIPFMETSIPGQTVLQLEDKKTPAIE